MRVILVGAYLGLLLLSWGITEEGFEEALGDPHLLILLWGTGWFAGAHIGYRLSTQGSRGRRRAYALTALLTLTALTLLREAPSLRLAGYLIETTAVAVGLSLLVGTASRGTHNYTVKEAIARGLVASGVTSLVGGAILTLAWINGVSAAAWLAFTVSVVALLLAVGERDSLVPPAFLDALDELSSALAGMRVPRAGSLTLVAMLAVASSYSRLWTRYACNCGSPMLYALGGLAFSLGAVLAFRSGQDKAGALTVVILAILGLVRGEPCGGYLALSLITGYYSGYGYAIAHARNPMRLAAYSLRVSTGLVLAVVAAVLLAGAGFLHLLGLALVLIGELGVFTVTLLRPGRRAY
ncbi:MAG: hypothetical protein F7C33_07270 [Desulfurococcales archaeon]|nr:hypothetical protein [Desulfurococcales archaeon]